MSGLLVLMATMHCDTCVASMERIPLTSGAATIEAAREHLALMGWETVTADGRILDRCPRCLSKKQQAVA